MATTITKLFPSGILRSSVAFDEVAYNSVKVGPNGVYAAQFDEVSLSNSNSGSIKFNGSSQYLSLPGTAIPLSGTTFTMECWVYLTGYSSAYSGGNFGAGLLTTTNTSGANGGNFGLQWTIRGTASSWTALGVYANNGSISYNASYSFSLNTWYHVAVTHTSAGAWNLFVNGTSIGTTSNATTWTNNTPYAIGRNNQTGYEYYFPGYISNFRLVAGSVVYPSNFTTPTSTLTAISGTALLLNTTNDANYLKDSSTNNITITAVGSPISSPLLPFINPAESRTSTGTYIVRGYFDEYTYTIAPF